jgi:hypothetical protein
MNLEIAFPMHMRATPLRGGKERDVIMSYRYDHRVPEVATGETRVALAAGHGWQHAANSAVANKRTFVREYDGALYRKLDARPDQWTSAFSDRIDGDFGDIGSSISFTNPVERVITNPLSEAVHRHFDRKLRLANDGITARPSKVWPENMQSAAQRIFPNDLWSHANKADFDETSRKLGTIDNEAVNECLAMYAAQCERLLAIGGEIWCRTMPPCYVVEMDYDTTFQRFVSVHLGHPQEVPGFFADRLTFPLSAKDEMEEYAAKLGEWTGKKEAPPRAHIPVFKADADDAVFDFDYRSRQVNDLAQVLSVCVERAAMNSAPRRAKLEAAGGLDAVVAASKETQDENRILGRVADAGGRIEDIVALWKKAGKPLYDFQRHPALGDRVVADLAERAVEITRSRPISILTMG